MIRDQFLLDISHELIVDNFAGGGGASCGIELALGRHVDIAINHDPEAVAMHAINHPQTEHHCESVWDVDPLALTRGRPVGLAWFSPDCKHFSKAKGGKPRDKNIRGLAWVAMRWAALVRPRVIMLENVEEFKTWGPVLADGNPCPKRKGDTFRSFVRQLQEKGYAVDWRELRACDYGAPTIRKRLFLIARCDGQPIVWPEPTHGAPDSVAVVAKHRKPWRTAAECIDWSIPCPSIFERAKPLADATQRRIARGLRRYVIDSADPFIVGIDHRGAGASPVWSGADPLTTITAEARHAVVAPHLTKFRTGSTGADLRTPMPTITAGPKENPAGAPHALGIVAPTLVQTGYGERPGQAPRAPGLDKPLGTVVAGGAKHALVSAFMAKHFTGVVGHELSAALHTITATDHHSLVTANLNPDYGCDRSSATTRGPRADQRHSRRPNHETGSAIAVREGAAYRAGAGGEDRQERLPHRESLVRGQAVSRFGASGDLESAGRSNPTGNGCQPQGRQQAEQRSHQLGAVHKERESSPRIQNESAGGRAQHAPSHAREGHGASTGPSFGRTDVCRDSQEVGNLPNAGLPSRQAQVEAFLIKFYSQGGQDQDCRDPMHTIPTKDRLGLVTVAGEQYQIADIGMRMLEPHELYAAQGFPSSYVIAPVINGRRLPKHAQVRMCGNSVSPPMAAALARANVPELASWSAREAKRIKEAA